MATPRIILTSLSAVLAASTGLACGPFFYQAPPALDAYPERYGVRTWREIFPEKYPPPADARTASEIEQACRELAARVGADADLISQIDELLEANRAGDYRVRFANLLGEMRELVAGGVDAAAARAYLDWRLARIGEDDGFIRRRPEQWRGLYLPAEALAKAQAGWDADTKAQRDAIDAELAKCPPALRPNWMVQRGAAAFRRGDFAAAAADFDAVSKEYPASPRAEAALLMRARCGIEMAREATAKADWRPDGDERRIAAEQRNEAIDLLRRYEREHPNGRFLADAIGWEGAARSDFGDTGAAVGCYLRQMRAKPTREVIRSALRECDRCFSKAVERGEADSLPMAELAAQPAAAMSFVYHCLDNGARADLAREDHDGFSGDRASLRRIDERVVRPRRDASDALLRLGREVAKTESNYGDERWRGFYLAVLAWIAIENGEYEQAMLLTDRDGAPSRMSADVLLCRGVALERLGRFGEALAAYRELSEREPNGALSVDLPYRIATCERQFARSGSAAVEMQRLNSANAPPEGKFPVLRSEGEVDQWVDTLLQFAPLSELESALAESSPPPDVAERIRSMIRCRAIARGDFETARRWLSAAEPGAERAEDGERYSLDAWARMDRARWEELVEPILARKQEVLAATDRAAKAHSLMRLGAQWEAARGKLTSPSLDPMGIFNSEAEIADLQRRKNARLLGLATREASEELDRRDETWHALQAYLNASELAADKATRARALAAANRCLFRMAELTPYQAGRAAEKHCGALSRALYERLKTECAGTPEARAAVYYTFAAGPERGEWMPGDFSPWRSELAIAKAMHPGPAKEWSAEAQPEFYLKQLRALAAQAGLRSVGELRAELARIRANFLPHFDSAEGATVINDLDDLELFLSIPNTSAAVRAKYFQWRMAGRAGAPDDPEMAAVSDFVDFLRLIEPDGDGRRTNETVEGWQEFLRKHPASVKAEAARLRLARLIYRNARTHVGVEPFFWPDAPVWNGYKRIAVTRRQPPGDPRVLAALDDYDKRHPGGRYAAEVRLMRAGVAIDAGDYGTAIACLTAVLDDPGKRDLHLDASLALAGVYLRLLDDAERPAIVRALARQPQGLVYLDRLIAGGTCAARLRPLRAFIEEACRQPAAG